MGSMLCWFALAVPLLLATAGDATRDDDTRDDDQTIVSGTAAQKIDELLAGLAEKGVSGTVLVANKGSIILCKGYGQANKVDGVACGPDTVYDIGSITKQFTAAAILRLEMMGKLAVTDSITKYLSDVPDDKRAITLHQLLTHTAGLIDVLGGDYVVLTRDDMLRQAMASRLESKPGTQHTYSNLGYSILAAIVELVSGDAYEDFLEEHLFSPAGMKQTGYRLPAWPASKIAVGYRQGMLWGTPLDKLWAEDGPYWNLRGNGGLLSTAHDMYRWHLALTGDKILSKEAKQKLFTPHVRERADGKSAYAYGWVIQPTDRGTTLVWHNGGNGVFFADFWRYVDEDLVIFLATNDASRVGEAITPKVAKIVRDAK